MQVFIKFLKKKADKKMSNENIYIDTFKAKCITNISCGKNYKIKKEKNAICHVISVL